MVYETRKVVEDYVLYKIKHHITSQNSGGNLENGAPPGANMQSYTQFPQPQDPPSNINHAVRIVCHDFEEMYRSQYPDLLEKIRALHVATWDIDKVFTKITKDVFKIKQRHGNGTSSAAATNSPIGNRKSRTPSPALQDSERTEHGFIIDDNNVKWGHIIALIVFTGVLAVRCVEINNNGQVDEIVNWVTKFLDTKLNGWLHRHGGWDGFVQWYEQGRGNSGRHLRHRAPSQIASALQISGAVAVMALGAFALMRK